MREKNRFGKISLIVIMIASAVGMSGCKAIFNSTGTHETELSETDISDLSGSEIEVIKAGNSILYLDEVRYYAYNTQATYEAYYMAEKEELDWNKEMSEGVSLEEAVLSTVLDSICEREAIVQKADEYQVSLTEDEWNEVYNKVDMFFDETNSKLLEKINVTGERLVEIFGKDALFEKVKEVMEETEHGKSESVYKNWKKANTVTTNEYWDAINYDTPIFVDEN